MIGVQRPRLWTLPAELHSSAGLEAVELAAHAGLYLDDWQKYVLINSLFKRKDGKWSAFELLLIVSRQNGKGSCLEARELAGLYLFESDRLLIHTAHEHKTSAEHYLRVSTLIHNTPDLSRRVVRESSAYGREFIQLRAQPTIILGAAGKEIRRGEKPRLIFIARSGGSGRGFTGDFIAYDEAMILDADKVSASLPSLMARPNPQVFYAASAGLKTSSQLGMLRRRMVAADEARRELRPNPAPALAGFEWSINWHDEYCKPDCKLHDNPAELASVAKANPGLGIRITEEMVARARDAFAGNEVGFNREILGVGEYPAPQDGWLVIPEKWYRLAQDLRKDPPRVTRPVFAVEVSWDRQSAAIGVAGQRSDSLTGLQVVDYRSGTGWLVARCREIHEQWQPAAWVVDQRAQVGSLVTELEKAGLPVVTMQARDVANACGLVYDAFRDGTVRHYGQPTLKAALAAAMRRDLSESWAFDRRNSGADISPLMVVTFALWGFMTADQPEDYDIGESVHFDIDEIIRICRAGVYGPADIRRLYEEGLIDDDGMEALKNAGVA